MKDERVPIEEYFITDCNPQISTKVKEDEVCLDFTLGDRKIRFLGNSFFFRQLSETIDYLVSKCRRE